MIASWTCPWCGEKAHRCEPCPTAAFYAERGQQPPPTPPDQESLLGEEFDPGYRFMSYGASDDPCPNCWGRNSHADWCPKGIEPKAPLPPSDNQSPSGALGAKPSNDGASRDVHALGNQTEELPAFEVRYRDFPHSDAYRVYANGRIEGFGVASLVVNRIPQLIAQARADSWAEAVASMASRRPQSRMLTREEMGLDRPRDPLWTGFLIAFGFALATGLYALFGYFR